MKRSRLMVASLISATIGDDMAKYEGKKSRKY